MEKVWFIQLNGGVEGPYSVLDLKEDIRITPDTFVWREGFSRWVPIGDVPELQEVFSEELEEEQTTETQDSLSPDEEIVLDFRKGPFYFSFWVLLLLMLLGYLLFLWA